MRSRTVQLPYTWEDDPASNAFCDFLITLEVQPTDPGDYDTPPSLGGVEITRVSLEAVTTETETHSALSEPRRTEIESSFLCWLYAPGQILVMERLEEQARIEADKRLALDYGATGMPERWTVSDMLRNAKQFQEQPETPVPTNVEMAAFTRDWNRRKRATLAMEAEEATSGGTIDTPNQVE